MASTFKTIKLFHPELGDVKVTCDAEDFAFLSSKPLYVKVDNSSGIVPRIAYNSVDEGFTYAHRAVLAQHKLLEVVKNVKPLDGDYFNLRKKNLVKVEKTYRK